MKPIIVEFTEDFLDLEDYQVERALQWAALDAMDRAEGFDTGFVISEDDKVRILKPSELGPYRERARQNLGRINRKIAELEAQDTSALVLNDRPADKPPGK